MMNEKADKLHTAARRYCAERYYKGDPAKGEKFHPTGGVQMIFPANLTTGREEAMEAAREFFTTGQLPRCVLWKSP